MLPSPLFDWWFEPWAYASNAVRDTGPKQDRVRLRDGYRLWCKKNAVMDRIPEKFDPAWSVAASTNGAELIAAARMFGGLIAVREQDSKALGALSPADRKWCLGIAATQPLRACRNLQYAADETMEARGLVELARRLEQGFPGMWSRLRLMLPPTLSSRIGELLQAALSSDEGAETSAIRAQRCWHLCRERSRAAGNSSAENGRALA